LETFEPATCDDVNFGGFVVQFQLHYPAHDVTWCAMLTDGADDPASHLGITVEELAMMNEGRLRDTLYELHRWKGAKHLPCFKQHDDKTIAVVRFS
jgi:hypothetical protein